MGHVCSKPACLGQRNNNGPLKTARTPKTIYSPRNTFTSPCQCTSTAVSETSCIASSCSSQLAVFPVSWHGYNSREILKCIREIHFPLETQLQFSSKAVPTRHALKYIFFQRIGFLSNAVLLNISIALQHAAVQVLLFLQLSSGIPPQRCPAAKQTDHNRPPVKHS